MSGAVAMRLKRTREALRRARGYSSPDEIVDAMLDAIEEQSRAISALQAELSEPTSGNVLKVEVAEMANEVFLGVDSDGDAHMFERLPLLEDRHEAGSGHAARPLPHYDLTTSGGAHAYLKPGEGTLHELLGFVLKRDRVYRITFTPVQVLSYEAQEVPHDAT